MKKLMIISLVVTIVLAFAVTKFVFAADAVQPVAEAPAEQPAKPVVLEEEETPAEAADQEFTDLLNELERDEDVAHSDDN